MNNSEQIKMRNVQLNLLKEFISICKTLNLNYFAIGGTAIGAVRHNGYIPWDDDIDVALLKEDYNIFIKEAPKLLPKHIFLQTSTTDPSYVLNGWAKLRDSRTTFIETTVSDIEMNHGIYIDIFVCYYVPNNLIRRKWHFFIQRFFYFRFLPLILKGPATNFITNLKIFIAKLLYPDTQKARKTLDSCLNGVPKSDRVIIPNCWWGINGKPRKWFEETISHPFENLYINIPREYDIFLKDTFGDYMKFPPLEEQKPHHFADVIDADTPYTNYK